MLLCKNRRLFAVSGDNSHVLTPIPVGIPWDPWIPVFPIPMHTSTRQQCLVHFRLSTGPDDAGRDCSFVFVVFAAYSDRFRGAGWCARSPRLRGDDMRRAGRSGAAHPSNSAEYVDDGPPSHRPPRTRNDCTHTHTHRYAPPGKLYTSSVDSPLLRRTNFSAFLPYHSINLL